MPDTCPSPMVPAISHLASYHLSGWSPSVLLLQAPWLSGAIYVSVRLTGCGAAASLRSSYKIVRGGHLLRPLIHICTCERRQWVHLTVGPQRWPYSCRPA